MTRWARYGSTQRHKKPPQDPTPWEEFADDVKNNPRSKPKVGKCASTEKKGGKLMTRFVQRTRSGDLIKEETSETGIESLHEESVINPLCRREDGKEKKKKLVTDGNDKSNQDTVPSNTSLQISRKNMSVKNENNMSAGFDSEQEIIGEAQLEQNLKTSLSGLSDIDSAMADTNPETEESSANVSSHQSGEKAERKSYLERLKYRRAKNGILLLPPKVERRLYILKRKLREKDVPGDTIKQVIRRMRRREELKFRKTLKICFKCRKMGHVLSQCPEVSADFEQGTGICFKCGSTEHKSFQCHIETSDFQYAQCFICREQGHLSRSCPKNDHGVYPKGGQCNLCGEIDHLKKDCPLKKKSKDEEKEVTIDTLTGLASVDEEVTAIQTASTTEHKKQKVVKF